MSQLRCIDCGYAGPFDEVSREGRTTSACPECDGHMERFDGPPGGEELCPECKAAMRHHEQGFCPYEIETGERFMESELTGETYRVTRWVERGEGKVISLQKEPVENTENQQKASR